MSLKWKRPLTTEYPKTWHTFSVLGENYRIQDLPPSMAEDVLQFLREDYFGDEPLSTAYGLHENKYYIEAVEKMYRTTVMEQKAVLVCFKEGSDEIVGINMNFVLSRGECTLLDFIKIFGQTVYSRFEQLYHVWIDKNYTIVNLKRNIERFEGVIQLVTEGLKFKSDKMLTAAGLCVRRKYRGRGIGVEILKARKPFCREFNIKWTVNSFSSHVGDTVAEKAGFKLDKKLSYDKIRKDYPHLQVPTNIKSTVITHRSMKID